ncbi:ABC transporter substrate-binding protein [Pseudonocardia kujensis]|uniref:ABC transporter substrate-binding protein n=1 Tax=Pseudonocardia kujensis TaxID=1128675 RepID=UPI001E2906EF|nr:ABC transporter substrate-binding protein [Pseudonocardia kujensis]MCE0768486.1 ABC transporter substrate-binding protein [Pseudonocardia kujensis]
MQIPVDPRRVVTVNTFPQDAMFDLGKDPVGVYDPGEQYILAAYRDRWSAIPKISGGSAGSALDLEKIAQLTPDLIIGIDAQQAPLDQLSKIAPTVLLPFTSSPTIWRELASKTADAVGRTGMLDPLKAKYTARAEQIKVDRAALLARTRFAILQGGLDQGAFWLYGPGSPAGAVLTDAGVQLAPSSAGVRKANRTVSLEEIAILRDADAILYYTNADGSPANNGPALFAQQAFRQLPAVTAGRFFGTTNLLPGSYTGAFGLQDDLDQALARVH